VPRFDSLAKHKNVRNSIFVRERMPDETDDGKTKLMRVRVSPRLFEYLGYLARHTLLGASENDVAEHVLTRRLEEMLFAGYHETRIPRDDSD